MQAQIREREQAMKNKSDVVTRAFSTEFRAESIENEHRIIGHAAVYNQPADIDGWFYEVIERGAFDDCDFKDVIFCVNHDTKKIPLARSRNHNKNSTLQLELDEIGLGVNALLDTERNADALALYSAVDRGDIGGMSFIFRVKDYKWENLDSNMPTKRITKISEVYEVTAATFPYYTGTDLNTARAKESLESDLAALESARGEAQKALESAKLVKEKAILKIRSKVGI